MLQATVANAQRPKGKRASGAKDFMPTWDRKPPQTWQDQLHIAKTLNRALGGTVNQKGVMS